MPISVATKMRESGANPSDEWRTPPVLFKKLTDIFSFDFDLCASEDNFLCWGYTSDILDYSLLLNLQPRSYFINPPFSRGTKDRLGLKDIMQIAVSLARNTSSGLIGIIPCRPESTLWQDHLFHKLDFIHFMRGRIKFMKQDGSFADAALFPCAIVGVNHSSEQVEQLNIAVSGKTFWCGENV